jgi:N-acetylglutamate synthase-like GNAT family acetyltransferase
LVEYSLRPATKADFPVIKSLIKQARINPTKLDWRRFTVAVAGGEVIGCIQLKPIPKDLMELASLAIHPSHRHQGIARALIEHLLSDAPRPIYLTCRSGLKGFYEKFDFQNLDVDDMPVYYRRMKRLVDKFVQLTHRNETLLVMKLG